MSSSDVRAIGGIWTGLGAGAVKGRRCSLGGSIRDFGVREDKQLARQVRRWTYNFGLLF